MRTTTAQGRSAGLACLLALCLATGARGADEAPVEQGMRLRAALRALEAQGLRIFYSTSIVSRRMRVETPPSASEPAAILAEILAPAGLGAERGPGGAWIVFARDDAGAVAAPEPPMPEPAVETPAPVPPRLEEVIVAASRYQLLRDISTSSTALEQQDLERIPSLGDDTIRVVNRLPGMASNGVSSRGNIRGGEVGEMLVRFDGLRLFDPFHLKDFQSIFSTLDSRVVSSMDVYTGGFPAPYGNRMSGVVDVRSMSPPADRYHEIGMSFFNSSVLSSGRFAQAKGEWVVSARRSNLDLLYGALSRVPERPGYVDTFGKVAYAPNERLRVAGHVFFASDDIRLSDDSDREEKAHADHDDLYYWLRFELNPSSALRGVTLLSRSHLDSQRDGESQKNGISHGSLFDERSFSIETVQTDWSRTLSERLLLQFGGTYDRVRGRYDYHDEVEFDVLFDVAGTPTQEARVRDLAVAPAGRQLGGYANLRFSPGGKLTADFGLRWDSQHIGQLDSETLSPRIGLRYALAEHTDLRLALGRYSQAQYIHELDISDGELEYSPPQRSDHLVLGVLHELASGSTIRVEAYEKHMADLRPRYENLLNSRILLPELKPDRIRIAPDSASARGLEIMYERRIDDGPSWWIGYSYAWVKDRLDGVEIYRSWDQTHALTAGANWTPGMWDISVAMIHRTGWPISRVELDDSGAIPLVRLTARNRDRLDDYRSFDVRAMRTYEFERSALTLSFELINALDHANSCCTEYEIGDEEDAGELLLKTLNYLPRVPSVGFLWKF